MSNFLPAAGILADIAREAGAKPDTEEASRHATKLTARNVDGMSPRPLSDDVRGLPEGRGEEKRA
eukprot:2944135-Rhodomonas_salina.2